ncbi:Similar to Cytochrome P450 52A1; acc. no. P10615 [Pyronema omphalodes CBS 100304]|uniref:Similar to Cytochrome P450 52A1 acc. no. P10615 n=1 Tax=Pyronema omphalodes (strain CBS 100304) TaxID=1076935 RepID=U4LQK1_PYROM|nr:Similar to Cytochrome P450 52A1; acc. no. P10615 [Pyronema omphalodes CBS 100304]
MQYPGTNLQQVFNELSITMITDLLFNKIPTLLAASLLGGCLMIFIYKLTWKQQISRLGKRSALIPASFMGLSEVYCVLKYAKMNKNREFWAMRFTELQNYTMELEMLWKRIIFTSEPENIKAVLATQFNDFGKGEVFHDSWHEFLGDSIFSTDGELWKGSRALIRPQFIKDRVSDLHIFENHVQHMISLIPRNGETVDIAELFFRFTLDSATDFLLGESVNSLGTTGEMKFVKAFAQIQQYQNDVTRLGPLRVFMPKGNFKENIKILNSFVEPFVKKTLQLKPEELLEKTETNYNFLHALAGFTRDPKVLRDQLVAVLLAGRDTTAGTLSWCFYELAKRPECVEILRQEILDTVGPDAAPTYAHLKGMKYLQHVMDETLRLYPAVPFNIRVALKDTVLPTGGGATKLEPVGVPAGTPIAYSALVMQRRKDIFGPDADEFRPERWRNWSPKPWTFIPFNGGPRICIGQQFAYAEMAYTIVRLFQTFDGVQDRMVVPQFERCETTISPGAGVKIALRPVKN